MSADLWLEHRAHGPTVPARHAGHARAAGTARAGQPFIDDATVMRDTTVVRDDATRYSDATRNLDRTMDRTMESRAGDLCVGEPHGVDLPFGDMTDDAFGDAFDDATLLGGAVAASAHTTDADDATRVADATVCAMPARVASARKPASEPSVSEPGGVMTATVFRERFRLLARTVASAIVGKDETIRRCLIAVIAGGHVLLEDEPGTGKTQLARAIARSLAVSFSRIQFTADLLPGDVTGTTVYDRAGGTFSFRRGPVFASIVLADEINRASPKTQSALLEVMEEDAVTVDGVRHAVPRPFAVIATQNPSDQLGTYRLPEAQLDRFLIRTALGHPGHEASLAIMRDGGIRDRAGMLTPVLSGRDLNDMAVFAGRLHADSRISEYAVRLTEALRGDERVASGPSIRGALALMRCARVAAAADGRDYLVPDDVADMAVPVLAHRFRLTDRAAFAGVPQDTVVADALGTVPVPESRGAGPSQGETRHDRI